MMIVKTICSAGLLTASLILSSFANAAPVSYSEPGDLNGTQSFNLDVGANTVSGTHQETPTDGNYDAWNFVLSAGLGISSITFDYVDPNGASNGYPNQGSFGITGPSNNTIKYETNINGNYSYAESFVDPLIVTGNYLVELTGNFVFPSGSWTTVFNVVSVGGQGSGDDSGPVGVPEPGSMALLSLGLLGLGFSRRKNSKA